jgi:hypothetical protein
MGPYRPGFAETDRPAQSRTASTWPRSTAASPFTPSGHGPGPVTGSRDCKRLGTRTGGPRRPRRCRRRRRRRGGGRGGWRSRAPPPRTALWIVRCLHLSLSLSLSLFLPPSPSLPPSLPPSLSLCLSLPLSLSSAPLSLSSQPSSPRTPYKHARVFNALVRFLAYASLYASLHTLPCTLP